MQMRPARLRGDVTTALRPESRAQADASVRAQADGRLRPLSPPCSTWLGSDATWASSLWHPTARAPAPADTQPGGRAAGAAASSRGRRAQLSGDSPAPQPPPLESENSAPQPRVTGDVQVPLHLGKLVHLRPASLREPEWRLITAPRGAGVTREEMPGRRRTCLPVWSPPVHAGAVRRRRPGAPATCGQAPGTWTGGQGTAHLEKGQVRRGPCGRGSLTWKPAADPRGLPSPAASPLIRLVGRPAPHGPSARKCPLLARRSGPLHPPHCPAPL